MALIKRWSSMEDQILLSSLNQQMRLPEIAARLGRRDHDVCERARMLGALPASMQQARAA